MHYTTARVLEPERYPLTLDETKAWCRVDSGFEDSVLQAVLEAAVDAVETGAGIRLRPEGGALSIHPGLTSTLQYTMPSPLRGIIGAEALVGGEWVSVPAGDISTDWAPLAELHHVACWPAGWTAARVRVVTGFGRWLVPKSGFPYTFPIVFGQDRLPLSAMHPVAGREVIDGDEYQMWPVPPKALQAVRMLLGHYFENREAVVQGATVAEVPLGAQTLIHQCRPVLYG